MVGKKIKFIREKQDLNQREFAKQFNISKSTLSRYERNETEIPLSFIIEIIKHYKLDANIFVYDNLFLEGKENFEYLNIKIYKEFKSLYDDILKCFKRISFHEQGLPEVIEKHEINLKKLLTQINFTINAADETSLKATIEIYDLLNSLEDLCLSLDIFLKEYSKTKNEIQNLLAATKQKIAYIHDLYNESIR